MNLFINSIFLIIIISVILAVLLHIYYAIKNKYNYLMACSSGFGYEKYISSIYKNKGYKVFENGVKKKYKDQGIDIVCSNECNLLLIQCKNHKRKIGYEVAKKFIKDCRAFEIEYKLFNVRRVIVSSSKPDKSMKMFLRQHANIIEYLYIPYKKSFLKHLFYIVFRIILK